MFIEQCITVDSPRCPPYITSSSSSNFISEDSDANGTHTTWNSWTSDLCWAGDDESNNNSNPGNWAGKSTLLSDSDDNVLKDSCSSHSPNGAQPSFARALSKTSMSKTITVIAPAHLKTTGMGNGWEGCEWVGTLDKGLLEEVQHLLPCNGAMEDANARQEDEVFMHRSTYFSADSVYNYLGNPNLGIEFGPTLEPWEWQGSTSTSTEILEIETEGMAPSPLRSYTPKWLPASSHVDAPAGSTWTDELDTGWISGTYQLIEQLGAPARLQKYTSRTPALEFGWYPPNP
ncbi:hypothetical protein B0H14DRAFT_2600556 [Mycena olivaceomarginata]|nr:hypothetical protein B0H14DRAFT_2600556 [Mycena olivaceomarginata]